MKWIKLGLISFILYFLTIVMLVGNEIQLSGREGAIVFMVIFAIVKYMYNTKDEDSQEQEKK